ncbi:PilZ domain-containing protein [bacterium]|nr:PilZ domain-containing protein [bacterium]
MSERKAAQSDHSFSGAYSDLLGAAAAAAARAVDRLHQLRERFPASLPPPVVEQFDRTHADPAAERRAAIRLPGGPAAELSADGTGVVGAAVCDRSAGGLGLRVGAYFRPGSMALVRLAATDGAWLAVQVRHARPDRDGWVVGCAFVADRPAV